MDMDFSCAAKHLCGMPGVPLPVAFSNLHEFSNYCIHCRGPIHGGMCGINLRDNAGLIDVAMLNPDATWNEREGGQPNLCHLCFNDLAIAVDDMAHDAAVTVPHLPAAGGDHYAMVRRTDRETNNYGLEDMGEQQQQQTYAARADGSDAEAATPKKKKKQSKKSGKRNKAAGGEKKEKQKPKKARRKPKKYYSLTEKLAILDEVDKKLESQEAIAARLGTTRKSIALWKKHREKMKSQVHEEGRGKMSRMHSDGLKRIKDQLKSFVEHNDTMPEDLKVSITGSIISTKAKVIKSKLLEAHARTPFLTPLEVKEMTSFRASEPWAYKTSKALGWRGTPAAGDGTDGAAVRPSVSAKISKPESSVGVLLRAAAENLGRSGRDVDVFVARLEEDWFNEAEQLRGRGVECLCRYMPLRLAEEVHRLVEAEYED